ncbi:hypothetical protein TSAR_007920, partial [Trichomalopsis sarcophagae]
YIKSINWFNTNFIVSKINLLRVRRGGISFRHIILGQVFCRHQNKKLDGVFKRVPGSVRCLFKSLDLLFEKLRVSNTSSYN